MTIITRPIFIVHFLKILGKFVVYHALIVQNHLNVDQVTLLHLLHIDASNAPNPLGSSYISENFSKETGLYSILEPAASDKIAANSVIE